MRTARVAPLITTRGRLRTSTSGRWAGITRLALSQTQTTAASRARRQRYWALAAIIRSRSAFVLHGEYDTAHQDHIHQDSVAPTRAFTTGSQAAVKLAQAVCKHIYAKTDLVIDGNFGPRSQAAVREAMITVELPGDIFDNSQWVRFLLRSGRLGFELSLQ